MADALVGHGRSQSIEPNPENVEDFQNFPGEGVYGKIDGKDIYIGNWRIGLRAGCEKGFFFFLFFIELYGVLFEHVYKFKFLC